MKKLLADFITWVKANGETIFIAVTLGFLFFAMVFLSKYEW